MLLGALLTAVASVVMHTSGDESVLGTLLLYAPRRFVPMAWLVLALSSALVSRRWALFALVCSAASLVFFAGFRLPLPAGGSPSPAGVPFRVVTYNVDYAPTLAGRLGRAAAEWDADLIVLQGCSEGAAVELRQATLGQARVAQVGEFCIATSHPPIGLRIVSLPDEPEERARPPFAVGIRLRLGTDTITAWSVHLASPRSDLSAALRLDLSQLLRTSGVRAAQVSALERHIANTNEPFVIAGDFNLVAEGQIFRRLLRSTTSLFDAAGSGFGFTMKAGLHRLRIDHVLLSSAFEPVAIRVDNGWPTEHQPVVADMVLRP